MKLENKIKQELVSLYWKAFSDGRVWKSVHADENVLASDVAKRWREQSIIPAERNLLEAMKREVKKARA